MTDLVVRCARTLRRLRHFAPLVVLSATAAAAIPGLTISNEIAPPGGWAQIKIYATKPVAITTGRVTLNLDATAFGPGALVGLFGANGDATGLATTTGSQIAVQFSSPSGGIGQLAGLPVMVISVPVLASASGRTVTVSATSPDSSVTIASGSVTVQGTLSVQKIYAGLGVVPAGTVVPVYGSGFTASTTVVIDGVVTAPAKFVSASEIDVTIEGAAELVGKRVRVTENGVEFDYFCFQPNDPVNFPENTAFGSMAANVQPLFPLLAELQATANISDFGGAVEVQNPNPTPATVNVANVALEGIYDALSQSTVTIPPGSWAIFDGHDETQGELISNLPVRAVAMSFVPSGASVGAVLQPLTPTDYQTPTGGALALAPPSLLFGWQIGASVMPAAQKVTVTGEGYIKAATVTSGASWLTVSKTTFSALSVSVNPAQLAIGTYQGSIFVTQSDGPPETLPVTLTVTNAPVPTIFAAAPNISFTAPAFNAAPYTQSIAITSDSGPAPFTVTAIAGGGGACCFAWLKVTPTSGTTPATLTVTWDPAATSQIPYYQPLTNGSILISGPANSITIPATFNVTGVQTYQTSLGEGGLGPNGLVFSAQTGTAAQTQMVYVYPMATMTLTVDQPWLTAVVLTNTGLEEGEVSVTMNPAGLAAGVYTGNVTIAEQGIAPISVPVTLGVWSTPPSLTATQSSLTFVQQIGEPAPPYQTLEVDSGGVPVPLTFAIGGSWLNLINRFTLTPAPIQAGITVAPTVPGEYDGSFTVGSPGGSVYVPVTLLVEPGPTAPPVISQVVNGASGIAGSVAPGEILEIRGYGVGSSLISGLKLDASGKVATNLNGLQVTFDGQPAPLIYSSADQVNLIVPYEIAGKISTAIQVQSLAWVLPVAASAPGIFTVDGTGTGQAAAINQDGTVNSTANPAAGGSIISIYATGEGQTSPAGVTGSVASGLKTSVLPVTLTINGIATTVQYAGSAPGLVSGLLQVNAVVPSGIAAGAVPVTIGVGGVASQTTATIFVKP